MLYKYTFTLPYTERAYLHSLIRPTTSCIVSYWWTKNCGSLAKHDISGPVKLFKTVSRSWKIALSACAGLRGKPIIIFSLKTAKLWCHCCSHCVRVYCSVIVMAATGKKPKLDKPGGLVGKCYIYYHQYLQFVIWYLKNAVLFSKSMEYKYEYVNKVKHIFHRFLQCMTC